MKAMKYKNVKRGDYTRVLAEYCRYQTLKQFDIGLSKMSDHPELEKKFQGTGNILSDLE